MLLQFDSLIPGLSITYIIVVLIINIAICVWVYKDAEAKGKGGVLWCIIVFFCGCIGCIVYLIVRNK